MRVMYWPFIPGLLKLIVSWNLLTIAERMPPIKTCGAKVVKSF